MIKKEQENDNNDNISKLNKISAQFQQFNFYSDNNTNSYINFKTTTLVDNEELYQDEDFQDAIDDEESLVTFEKKSSPIIFKKAKKRRTQIPQRPNNNINCIELLRNCVGKSLDEIPIPFNYREPLSMLQRLVEEIEYTDLLDKASQCSSQWEQMAYVAAFSVSCYGTTSRTNKPFNGLLGETFEYDCSQDIGEGVGWRAIAEQVSITPPAIALDVESVTHDWHLYHEFSMSSKFRLQYLQVIPVCTTHLVFKKTGYHYTWNKVNTFVHNLVLGKIWVENVGELDIINHTTKDTCHLKYSSYNIFSSKSANKVNGLVTDSNNITHYGLNGTWTDQIEATSVFESKELGQQNNMHKNNLSKTLWKKKQIS